MSRALFGLIAVIATYGVVNAEEKDDLKAAKGTWKITKAIFMGKDSTELFTAAVLTIDGDKYTVAFGGTDDKGTLKIDSTKKPKRMTIVGVEGPSKGKTREAIYELDGDTMKICYATEGKEPPKAFESKEGASTLYVEYKREKK